MSDLFQKYETQKAEVERLEAATDQAKLLSRETLQEILTLHGKGPHRIGGKQCSIIERKGTLCCMNMDKPRGKRKAAETQVA